MVNGRFEHVFSREWGSEINLAHPVNHATLARGAGDKILGVLASWRFNLFHLF